jgi:hypothetical protein
MRPFAKTILSTVALTVLMLTPTVASAAEAPVKENLSAHIGWEVDKTIGGSAGKICTIASGHECQPGKPSNEPGGYNVPRAIAINDDPASSSYHNIYVVDLTNHRVQQFAENGEFVSMFGWEVNKTKVELRKQQEATHVTVTQTEENICTAASHETCQAGVPGPTPGQINQAASIAVDPKTGDIYTAEFVGDAERIQEFSATGAFLSEIGKEVNTTKDAVPTATTAEKNVCTEQEMISESVQCAAPKPNTSTGATNAFGGATSEQDAFGFATGAAVLVFGGPEGLLYVGEEGRIQEFDEGKYESEVSLNRVSSEGDRSVSTLAVDPSGEIYLVYEFTNVIYRVSQAGVVTGQFTLVAEAQRIALSPSGRLAVVELELGFIPPVAVDRGVLYDVSGDHLHVSTEFLDPVSLEAPISEGINDIVFNDGGRLYATDWWRSELESANEVLAYTPVPVAELSDNEASLCNAGTESETDVTVDCTLKGQVDPWGISGTEVWFESGVTPGLGSVSVHQHVASNGPEGTEETPVAVTDLVEGLRPDQTVYYRVAGHDHNAKAPETLTSEIVSFKTPSEPPRIVGAPSASFVKSFSVDIFGEVNPENTNTEYYAEYAPQTEAGETLAARCPDGVKSPEKCEGIASTAVLQSNEYGRIGATLEATGLRAATIYRYRLFAHNTAGQSAVDEKGGDEIQEGTFKTLAAPVPQAESEAASRIGTTSATIAGNVNPDGQPAVYTFQLGLYNAAETRFGTILSAPAGSGTVPVLEQEALTGLQPGTTYAYRVGVSSAYGTSYGAASIFTTLGLPATLAVPSPLTILPIPPISFPTKPKTTPSCKHGYTRNKHNKCIKTKPKPTKKTRKTKTANPTRKTTYKGGARR